MEYSKNNDCIIDFFSWHSYASVEKNPIYAQHARERLDAYGFIDCEVFLNEWNTGIKNRGTARDAADILAMMIAMQNSPTDMCMYYDAAERSDYCGIFNPITHDVFKAYYSFFIFGQMYAMGEQCFAETNEEKLFVMAAKGKDKKAFVIVNDSECEKNVELCVTGVRLDYGKVKAIDDLHAFDDIDCLDKTVVLPPFSIRYVEF